jgi:hypothetical protein
VTSKQPHAPRRRWNVESWPHPEDGREDRPKRVALSYRQLAADIAQGNCPDPVRELHQLDERWLRHGAFWVVPSFDPYDPTEWVHAADAAHYADVEPGTIRKWAERGHIRVDHDHTGAPIYNIGDLRDHGANRARARIDRARRE